MAGLSCLPGDVLGALFSCGFGGVPSIRFRVSSRFFSSFEGLFDMMDPFASARLLLARANKHLTEFEIKELIFIDAKPYSRFHDIDPETGETRLRARLVKPLPPELPAIAFDILNCLRSALDHAVFDSARELGATPKPKFTKFPFGKTPKDAENDLSRKNAEVPDSIRPFLLSFEPYEGGKEGLFELNDLRNGKIHRILAANILTTGAISFGNGFIQNLEISVVSEWDAAKGELTYMRTAPGGKANIQLDFAVSVAFGEETPFNSKRAFTVLRDFSKITSRIISGIEAETARLRGIP